MCSQNSKCNSNPCGSTNTVSTNTSFNFIILIVLYILLAIILGAWIWN